jgi:Protein of unknown function (DUF3822)
MPSEPSFQICSPAFTIDDIGSYSLHLELSKEALRLTVLQSTDLIALEEYTLENSSNIFDRILRYREIIDEHIFLKANYWASISVATESPLTYPISKVLFDQNQIPTYELLIFQKPLNAAYVQYENTETVFLMAYDSDLQSFIEEIYPEKGIQIQSSAFKMAKYFEQNQSVETVVIHCSENHISAYHWVANQFILDTYAINSISEKDLKENFQAKNCILYGQITTFHPLYTKLNSTFSNLTFGTLPAKLKTPSFMAELPAYRYMSLLV